MGLLPLCSPRCYRSTASKVLSSCLFRDMPALSLFNSYCKSHYDLDGSITPRRPLPCSQSQPSPHVGLRRDPGPDSTPGFLLCPQLFFQPLSQSLRMVMHLGEPLPADRPTFYFDFAVLALFFMVGRPASV